MSTHTAGRLGASLEAYKDAHEDACEDARQGELPPPRSQGLVRWNPVNLAAGVILAFLLAALLISARRNSIGIDEIYHISSGVSYIRQADPRMNYEHPPLMKLLAGSAAVLAGARTCTQCQSWQTDDEDAFATDFMHPFPGQRVIWLARLPMVALTLCLALAVFAYGSRIAGAWGGLLSLLLFSTYPLILGFGFAVMNDVVVTLFSVLTCLGAARVWQKPGIQSSLLLGCPLALALLSKYSGILLVPFLLLYWVILRRAAGAKSKPRFPASAIGSLLIACALTWAVYTVFFHNATSYKFLEHYAYEAHTRFDPAQVHGPLRMLLKLGRHPVLDHAVAPILYYAAGVDFVRRHANRPAFLLGRVHVHGTWIYFPVLTLLHSPPGFLAILMLAAWLVFVRARWLAYSPETISLALFIVLFTAVALASPLDIGLRHLTPVLTGLMILASLAVPAAARIKRPTARKWARGILIAAAVEVVYTAAAAWPFYLPYCNFLRMNHPAAWISSDSNADVGFYMPEAHTFAVAQHAATIGFVPFHDHYWNLQAYIPEAQEWECSGPLPRVRWVVVSAHRLYDPYHPEQCAGLWSYRHRELAGGSMFAFDLNRKLPGS